ncbi:DUF6283 family protein [Streptomyces sp. NPDC048629]|uniref:DUF6283 family protein n=1 Tax=Streptomyces sp. NPDC048629 TaxID=3154824 RepID=UPI003418780B
MRRTQGKHSTPTHHRPRRFDHCGRHEGSMAGCGHSLTHSSLTVCQARHGVCGGWTGCHDSNHLLALRVASSAGDITAQTAEAIRNYTSQVSQFDSGGIVYPVRSRRPCSPPARP